MTLFFFLFLIRRRPPISTRINPCFPDTTLFRSPGFRRRWDELIGGGAGSHGAGEGSTLPPVRRRVVFRPGAFRPIAAAVEYVQDRELPVRQRVGDDVGLLKNHLLVGAAAAPGAADGHSSGLFQIGRASGRERAVQSVSISVVAVSLKHK